MKYNVLDHGYVRLIDTMGSDLTIVNTARVSFDKESDELTDQDKKLIGFLVKNRHDSCFRHNVMTFEFYAPLFVARQIWKHVVASSHLDDQVGWNETSRRYITEDNVFYVPDHFSLAPENKKQGAGGLVNDDLNANLRQALIDHQRKGEELYQSAIDFGVAPEQARLFVPAYGMYVRWRWTGSLNAIMNFLDLRLDSHAQGETQEFARGVEHFVSECYPETYTAWCQHRRNNNGV